MSGDGLWPPEKSPSHQRMEREVGMFLTTVNRSGKGAAFYFFDAALQFEEFFLEGG